MKVGVKVKMGMTLFHAQTMKELRIDNVIEKCYDEDSPEYKNLCDEYTEIIGFKREEDKVAFDKELLIELAKEVKSREMETIKTIEETIKTCYLKNTSAYVTFAGHIINPKDFCAVRIDGFNVQFSKN